MVRGGIWADGNCRSAVLLDNDRTDGGSSSSNPDLTAAQATNLLPGVYSATCSNHDADNTTPPLEFPWGQVTFWSSGCTSAADPSCGVEQTTCARTFDTPQWLYARAQPPGVYTVQPDPTLLPPTETTFTCTQLAGSDGLGGTEFQIVFAILGNCHCTTAAPTEQPTGLRLPTRQPTTVPTQQQQQQQPTAIPTTVSPSLRPITTTLQPTVWPTQPATLVTTTTLNPTQQPTVDDPFGNNNNNNNNATATPSPTIAQQPATVPPTMNRNDTTTISATLAPTTDTNDTRAVGLQNNNNNNDDDDNNNNTVAGILAGALSGLLVVVVAGVAYYLFWRRRQTTQNKQHDKHGHDDDDDDPYHVNDDKATTRSLVGPPTNHDKNSNNNNNNNDSPSSPNNNNNNNWQHMFGVGAISNDDEWYGPSADTGDNNNNARYPMRGGSPMSGKEFTLYGADDVSTLGEPLGLSSQASVSRYDESTASVQLSYVQHEIASHPSQAPFEQQSSGNNNKSKTPSLLLPLNLKDDDDASFENRLQQGHYAVQNGLSLKQQQQQLAAWGAQQQQEHYRQAGIVLFPATSPTNINGGGGGRHLADETTTLNSSANSSSLEGLKFLNDSSASGGSSSQNRTSSSHQRQEEFQVQVPPGPLGLLMEGSTVRAIAPDCVFATRVQVGDVLVAIDGIRVQHLSQSAIAAVVQETAHEPRRCFTFTRIGSASGGGRRA